MWDNDDLLDDYEIDMPGDDGLCVSCGVNPIDPTPGNTILCARCDEEAYEQAQQG